jgi:hypothetical protein
LTACATPQALLLPKQQGHGTATNASAVPCPCALGASFQKIENTTWLIVQQVHSDWSIKKKRADKSEHKSNAP